MKYKIEVIMKKGPNGPFLYPAKNRLAHQQGVADATLHVPIAEGGVVAAADQVLG